MMKHIKILTAFALLLAFSACEKDRAFVEFEDLGKGALPRLLDGVNGEFNFFDPAGSGVDFTVEFYDENDGKNVQSYSWAAAYIDRATNTIGNPATVATFTQSDFKPEPSSGLPSITINFSFQQVLDALGLSTNDITGGDAIRMTATLTKTDGSVFTVNNTDGTVISNGPAFGAMFLFDQNIICPSNLEGTYSATTTYHQHDFIASGYTENTQDVVWTALGSGQYEVVGFDGGLYAEGNPYNTGYGTSALTVVVTDACGNITFDGAVDPWQQLLQDPTRPTTYDPATGVITISVLGDVYGENWTTVYTPK